MKPAKQSSHILHVATNGNDRNAGREDSPLRSIHAAAQIAMPGDTVRVHAGTYREAVHPARGGNSNEERITYEPAPGEAVEILGSEVIREWKRVESGSRGTWTASVSNEIFGDFNPFATPISGDWFWNRGRPHTTGGVYLNGRDLLEATTWKDLQESFWYAEVGEAETTFWINCGNDDPNGETIEINARPTVFYPKKTGINYITVRGFTMRHAATNWAPPTAEQVGLIGTNWSKGWVIEDNTITHSRCVGVTLGKYGDEYDNTSAELAEGYVTTVRRAEKNGWSRDQVGSHLVCNNTIAHCEQAGIVGSLGAIFSEVSGNTIHDIHVHRLFDGVEQAGIKFHAPINTLISGNHIYRAQRGMWMDWMTQGTRITGNLCHNNSAQDLFLEVNHGPFVVDNNLFLSNMAISSMSQGGAYLHNLIAGRISRMAELGRETPYHRQGSVEIVDIVKIRGGDDRYLNNLFLNGNALEATRGELELGPNQVRAESPADQPFEDTIQGNLVLPCAFILEKKSEAWVLRYVSNGAEWKDCPLVGTEQLGRTHQSQQPFLNYDGRPLVIDGDYLGVPRAEGNNRPGPFNQLPDLSGEIIVREM